MTFLKSKFLLKFNNRNTWTRYMRNMPKLTIKTQGYFVKFEYILNLILEFPLLTLNRRLLAGMPPFL